MKRILVSGGNGLIGQAIKKNLEICSDYEFIFISSKDGDLRNWNDCYDIFNNIQPDMVIHLAANVGGLYKNMKYPVQMLNDNLDINNNVIKCCYEFGIKKAIFCLSTCIFPDKTVYPINEDMLHNGPPHHSNAPYAYVKRLMEVQCNAYNNQFNTNYMCIIPTNIYGEYDNFNLEDSHVIPALIHNAYLSTKNNTKFTLKGTGNALRQFIYSDDLAKIILYLIKFYNKDDLKDNLIITSVNEKDEISIKDVANIIKDEFEIDNIYYDDSYLDGQYKKTANNSRLIDFFKKYNIDFKFTSIKTGLKQTIEWFKNNYNSEYIRK